MRYILIFSQIFLPKGKKIFLSEFIFLVLRKTLWYFLDLRTYFSNQASLTPPPPPPPPWRWCKLVRALKSVQKLRALNFKIVAVSPASNRFVSFKYRWKAHTEHFLEMFADVYRFSKNCRQKNSVKIFGFFIITCRIVIFTRLVYLPQYPSGHL